MSIREKNNPSFVSLALVSERQSWAPKAELSLRGAGWAVKAEPRVPPPALQLRPPVPWRHEHVLDELLSWDTLVSATPWRVPLCDTFSEYVTAFIGDL